MENMDIQEGVPSEMEFVRNSLIAYNLAIVPFPGELPSMEINKVIKGMDGEIIAGIKGDLYAWNCLYIDILWVAETHRKSGYGSVLLQDVEKTAAEHGCRLIHLDTFDFQAKDFYIRHGFEVFGVLDDCPEDHKRYYMKKRLAPVPRGA